MRALLIPLAISTASCVAVEVADDDPTVTLIGGLQNPNAASPALRGLDFNFLDARDGRGHESSLSFAEAAALLSDCVPSEPQRVSDNGTMQTNWRCRSGPLENLPVMVHSRSSAIGFEDLQLQVGYVRLTPGGGGSN